MGKRGMGEVPDILFLKPEDNVLKRLQICLAFRMGVKKSEIAAQYNVDLKTIFNLCRSLEKEGIKGLLDRPRPGKPQILEEEDKRQALTLKVKDPSLGCRVIAEEIESAKGSKVGLKTIERFLKSCGLLSFHGTGVKKSSYQKKERIEEKPLAIVGTAYAGIWLLVPLLIKSGVLR